MPDQPKVYKFILGSLLNTFLFLLPGIVVFFNPENMYLKRLVAIVFLGPFWLIGEAVLYKVYWRRVKPSYPLGVADPDDTYFPRFNIPRPLYLDEIKRKQREATREREEDN